MAKVRSRTIIVDRQTEDIVLQRTRDLIEKKKQEAAAKRLPIVEWAEKNFYVASTGDPIVFASHQKSILKAAFTRMEDGSFPFRLIVLSSIKKSGKTCLAAAIARWIAEEQTRFGEIAITGNDQRQARERSYEQMMESIRLTPGFRNRGTEGVLPERWLLQASKMTCLSSGTKVEALSVDARGEAGANPDLTIWCVDQETEALTRKGFKFVHELTIEDEIATLDPSTGFMEWHHPRAVNVKPYEGLMVRFDHRRANFMVTPNHRVYGKFFTNSRYSGKKNIAHKRKTNLDGWRLEEATVAAKYVGGELKANASWAGETYTDPIYARLLGYYIAEGYTRGNSVTLYQTANTPVYEDMFCTAEALGYSPQRKERSIVINDRDLAQQLHVLGRSWEKYIPEDMKNAQPEALQELFLGYMLGDGWGETVNLEDRLSMGGQCSTVSKQLADDLMEVALKIGFVPRLMNTRKRSSKHRLSYRLSFSTHPIVWGRYYGDQSEKSHWKIEQYEGLVACPSVPHGIFYIRREGKCCWTGNTELWGYEDPSAVKFFHEMTPPPTKPDSIRLIETYAGFDGESYLLREHFDLGKAGRQLTAGELAEMSGEPWDVWEEIHSSEDLVPIWINDSAGMFMYWDSGLVARRMPWQQGKIGERYYVEEEQKLPPPQFHRLHMNEWVGGEGEFLPMSAWDRCHDKDLPTLEPGDNTPAILGVDAATTKDCFGVVLVTRHPDRPEDPAIRACKKWDPNERGGRIDYDEPEAFIRTLLHGGCLRGHPQYEPFRRPSKDCDHATNAYACEECCEACRSGAIVPGYNIIEVAYDPYQLESIMGRLYKEGINAQPFSQQQERMIADSQLYDVIIQRRLSHHGSPIMREHILNCAARQSKDEDTKLRIIKKSPERKVDLAIAASMAIRRCLYLLIG